MDNNEKTALFDLIYYAGKSADGGDRELYETIARKLEAMFDDLKKPVRYYQDLWVTFDGTYGTGDIALINTKEWLDDDWDTLDNAGDRLRLQTAIDISKARS